MKNTLRSVLILLSVCLWANRSEAQVSYELTIDSLVGIPDTIVNGQEVTFYMIVSMNSPLFYQGNIFVELEYNGVFYPVDTATTANASLSPNSPNTIQASHIFSTDDDLSIGDNVVVVWPRIGDGISPQQEVTNPLTVYIHMVEPNGIIEQPTGRILESFLAPNPAITSVQFNLEPSIVIARSTIYDLSGRVLAASNGNADLDISGLPEGIYFVDVLTQKGQVYTDKLLISR